MIQDHSFEVQLGRFFDARPRDLTVIIENGRRRRWTPEVVGEEISGKEDFFLAQQKPAMPGGVAGEGDHLQAVNCFSGLKPMIDLGSFESEEESPDRFERPRNLAPSPVVVSTFHVIAIGKRGINPAVGQLLEFGDVQAVIEMAVGQENAPDIRKSFAVLAEGLFDSSNPSDKSAVDQISPVIRNDEVVLHDEAAQ